MLDVCTMVFCCWQDASRLMLEVFRRDGLEVLTVIIADVLCRWLLTTMAAKSSI